MKAKILFPLPCPPPPTPSLSILENEYPEGGIPLKTQLTSSYLLDYLEIPSSVEVSSLHPCDFVPHGRHEVSSTYGEAPRKASQTWALTC